MWRLTLVPANEKVHSHQPTLNSGTLRSMPHSPLDVEPQLPCCEEPLLDFPADAEEPWGDPEPSSHEPDAPAEISAEDEDFEDFDEEDFDDEFDDDFEEEFDDEYEFEPEDEFGSLTDDDSDDADLDEAAFGDVADDDAEESSLEDPDEE